MKCGELFLKGAGSTFIGYFLIVSIAFILYGLTTTFYFLKTNTLETLDEELVSLPSLCLLLFGCLLLVFIGVGCCAIFREIACCLEAYCVFLVVLAAAQLGLGIFSLTRFSVDNEDFQARIFHDVHKMFSNYGDSSEEMDNTQEWMKCCGINDPGDWLRNNTIPPSCCEGLHPDCTLASGKLYQDGCFFRLHAYIVGTNYIIGLSLIVTAVTEIIASMMGFVLSCAFWRNSRVMWI